MKNTSASRWIGLALAATTVALAVSCSQTAPMAPPAPSEVGRFQLIVAQEGERGTAMFLLDTKIGKTWFYRPPVAYLVNGFWSDIPQLTYGDDYWRQAFAKTLQNQPAAAPANTPPGTATPPPPAETNR